MSKSRAPLLSIFALLAFIGGAVPVLADDFGLQAVVPDATKYRLGNIRLLSLHDLNMVMPNDNKTFGIGQSQEDVAAVLRANHMLEDRIPVSINVLYAEDGKHHYLFDTGMAAAAKGNLLVNLAAHKIDPKNITDIFITHSHPDHVGGLLNEQGELAFPNATIHMAAKEWDYMKTTDSNANIVAKIEPQVVTFDKPGNVAPDVAAFPLPGHTPGHSGYRLSSKGKSITDIGDLAHSSVISLAKPDWAMGYDGDKDTGEATRRTELAYLAQTSSLIFATHFPYPGLGRIKSEGDGYVWQPE